MAPAENPGSVVRLRVIRWPGSTVVVGIAGEGCPSIPGIPGVVVVNSVGGVKVETEFEPGVNTPPS
jgi:hypothetical protein